MNSKDEYAQVLANGTPYDSMIRQEADREGIPYDFAHKLIFNESRFKTEAKSPTGPLGLGQFTDLTGKAYGLMSPEDRMDPQKAIPAVMRHLKDLKGAYGGDLLKTALAYNQGQGRLGSPQLAALDQGDFSKISPEGQTYMRNLLDVSGDSPSRKYFDALEMTDPGIHPKAKAVSFEDATQGLTANNPIHVGQGLPGLGAMGLKGGEAPVTQPDYLSMAKPEKTFFEGTADATKASVMTSPVPSILRYATQETVDPLDWVNPTDTSSWTRDDFDMIRKEGVDPQYFGFIMDYSKGKRANLPQAIAMAKESAGYEARINGAGTGAQIVGGFISAGVDPLTYAPIPGATGSRLVSRMAQGAMYGSAGAVASEGLREAATGIEGHYGTALVGGALFGAGATALFDRAAQRAVEPPREEVPDDLLEKTLAMHGESALPNERFDLHPEMESFDNNPFAGPAIRLEARETARQTGMDDPSRFPWLASEPPENIGGIDVVPHPSEPGAVRLQDGSILSADNPLNPMTLRDAEQFMPTEQAAKGVSMGGFTEIGYTLLRSENEAVRNIGGQLFRSPTGTVSGSNGKFGATASDIIERTASQDHVTYNTMSEQLLEAIKDPQFATQAGGRQAHMDMVNRRVAEAIEDSTGTKAAQLTPGERKMMETVRAHYDRKADYLAAPAQFGNRHARAILPETRHAGSYIPNVYSTAAKALHLRRFGDQEGLQHAISESWLASYAARPHVKARVDKFLTDQATREGRVLDPADLQAAVEDYATRKAFGIAKSDDFDGSNLLAVGDQGSVPGSMGLASNNFLEGRHLFDSDMAVPLSDGTQFAVNDLREFDLGRITPSYDRRVNGDIGIMGATGRTTGELLHDISKVKASSKAEKAALEESVKILTGRARREPEGALATTARILSDLSFVSKNAYMGVQSIAEVAGMVTKGHTRMLLKGVPLLRDMAQWGSKISANDLKDMHSMVFGRELDNHLRPTRTDIVERLRNQADVNPLLANVLGSIKFATQETSAWSPFTKFLTESSNYIADAGRSGVLSDLVDHVLAGRKSGLFEPQRLHSMSITPEQFEGIKASIREHMVLGKGGKYAIKDRAALQRDPRTMDMWRMGDKIAHETILRPHALSSADTVAYGAGVKMAMQFKNFTMRSVNSRLVRGYHDATKNGRAIDQTMQAVLSTGLAVSTYVAMKYSQAAGMPKDQREGFLKSSLDPKMLAYAGLSRSSHIGAPLGLLNIVAAPFGFDQGAAVRSSILPRGVKEKPEEGAMKYSATQDKRFTGFLGRITEQVPAVGVLANGYQAGYNAFGALGSDSRRADQEYMTGVFNGLRGLVPNDPVTQKLLLMMMEAQGVEIR
ncbi:transglycosylase SLT domain-containing protein [Pseudomonas lurida]|uniref:transglycosylase SLT domain-containing protein n=1 Tax=Pseudomonas lurida TaxID=244566 RepID=UPI00177EE755|nr:transglycosylase SLT domain-containing protein [Pseudomonas lurida]MBD8668999.1 transglycosylase SLT domain-containing protein [Pseudomonas lurida]UZQ75434.1 transglycosylase SLT domain-containing protein [Pseudomonas lurida]